jgi:WD40 repeat protein
MHLLWNSQVLDLCLFDRVSAKKLIGHSGEVFAARFDPTGNLIASGSMDRSISTRVNAHSYHFPPN